MECVGAAVCANVPFTDRIVRIHPVTGAVTASVDALGPPREDELVPGSPLNGIAAVPGIHQFLITGKLRPRIFRVAPAPADGRTDSSAHLFGVLPETPRPPAACICMRHGALLIG